jgi:tRNA pseudouridine38-40 synthase
MPRIKMLISYDGTDFCGWQKQKDHKHAPDKPSLQETIENALSEVFSEKIKLSASGRTDSGVHALAQITHFDTEKTIPKDLCWAIRSVLPPSIVAKAAWLAPEEFHSTLSATHKTYRYWIWNQQRPTALLHRYSYWIRRPLDLDFLNQASSFLLKNQDFKSFQSTGTVVKSSVRHVYKAEWTRLRSGLLEFKITGNGFLKQMVRNIVGTQVDLFLKQRKASEMQDILLACDRKVAGFTAPPQGLFLYKVYYPKNLDNKCRRI